MSDELKHTFFTSCMSYRLEHYLPTGIPQDRTCFVLPAGLIASPGKILPAECFNSSSSLYLPAGLSPAQTRFPTSLIFLLDLACMFTSCILTSLGNCFLAAGFFTSSRSCLPVGCSCHSSSFLTSWMRYELKQLS